MVSDIHNDTEYFFQCQIIAKALKHFLRSVRDEKLCSVFLVGDRGLQKVCLSCVASHGFIVYLA